MSPLRKRIFLLLCGVALVVFLLWRFVRPLNIFVVEDRFALPMVAEIPEGLNSLSAGECGLCHGEIYREWAESMHGKAWTDPYFQVDFVFDGSQQICLNCHIPLVNQQPDLVRGFRDRARFDPILEPNPDFDASLREEGVTCAVCHVRDGRIVGPFGSSLAPHPVTVDPGMTFGVKPCERCHVVSGNRWDTFYRIPPCGTVAEIAMQKREPDCVGCHMPEVVRPIAGGMPARKGKKHLFSGGHDPETVRSALTVRHAQRMTGGTVIHEVTLTNTGAAHYLPTGTPDRHLTLELRLRDGEGTIIDEKVHVMKRHILWRPFIMDLKDSRLPFGTPRSYYYRVGKRLRAKATSLDITVRYHLLDEKRRKRIGYRNTEPIAYSIYEQRVPLEGE